MDLSAEFLPLLESLDLSKNRITYLWGLHSFKYLRTLCLSYNCLETFNGNNYEKNILHSNLLQVYYNQK